MEQSLDYGLAFTAGLLGSGHCVGMCGSLVSAFFVRLGEGGKGILPLACYHGTRIGIYTLVGVLAAALGLALVSTGIIGKAQAILQILAGLVVIVLGLDILGWLPVRIPTVGLPAGVARRIFSGAGRRGPVWGAAAGGLMNGLMPCAMTLAIAVKATSAAHPLQGGLLMLAFGLGTLPAMVFVSVVFNRLGAGLRGLLLKGAAVVVIGLGVVTLMQGVRFFEIMRHLADW
ncbi:MAG: sulfite exporter TauE/SafE family protein [Bacteroidales bacterium]